MYMCIFCRTLYTTCTCAYSAVPYTKKKEKERKDHVVEYMLYYIVDTTPHIDALHIELQLNIELP